MAYSTLLGSDGSISSSTTTTCLRDGWAANAAIMAFLGSPSSLFFICITACNQLHPPSVRTTLLVDGTTSVTARDIFISTEYDMSSLCSLPPGSMSLNTAPGLMYTHSTSSTGCSLLVS